MARQRTTNLKCPFCSTVIFRLDEDGCIDEDFIDSSGCRHFAGTLDDDYFDEPQPGFEPLALGFRLWERMQDEGWTKAEVRAALRGFARTGGRERRTEIAVASRVRPPGSTC